ncbi:MAG: 30S ribosomal protein S21 [Candidatus Omnitrophica bacterium]|nr:30S ribosomal protein S21 [Candidatus Omnitrophota bacterium]MBU4345819.1 30S ribosomal protein S21 [Candidatus Omnitrophota bacterium]MBU4473422.1 30S ribosomal protein S21 [Candidatus Omnitrophota bacterium]MCG2706243.1 30S ribosomal protein S21 [Candidatus Omnitrophota bacterium]
MPENGYRKHESFEAMMRRFKRQIEHDGILREIRDRKHYEKPSERKRKKRKSSRGRK